MADLEVPSREAELFLARGDEVNSNRPLLTGDVISGVRIPVIDDQEHVVTVAAHPCSMRSNGVDLADLLLVAPISEHSQEGEVVWRRHLKVSPLDGLQGFSRPVVRLDRVTLIRSAEIDIENRVACASRLGINLLRQRLVHHLTRVVVETWKFDEEAAGTYEEVDLCEEWVDRFVESGLDVATALAEFHEWIRGDEGGSARQYQLENPQTVQAVRRSLRTHLRGRFTSAPGQPGL